MIDYEVRFLTKNIWQTLLRKDKREPMLLLKLRKFKMNRKRYLNFFLKAKKIKEIYLRGLPINNKRDWYLQEETLQSEFIEYIKFKKIKLKIKKVTIIPNLNNISSDEFLKLCKKKKIKYFEFNSHWLTYKKSTYNSLVRNNLKVFNFINKNKFTLFLEPKFLHEDAVYFYPSLTNENTPNLKKFTGSSNFFYFLKFIYKKYSNINIYIQRMGGGIFIDESFFKKNYFKRLMLLSSASSSIHAWLKVLTIKEFRKIKLGFASDHPFNSYRSIKMYNAFNKFLNK